jgi:hypothetical protein
LQENGDPLVDIRIDKNVNAILAGDESQNLTDGGVVEFQLFDNDIVDSRR